MRLLTLATVSALLVLACANPKGADDSAAIDGPGDADTDADTDSDADCNKSFAVVDYQGDDQGDATEYIITTTCPSALVELDMTQTGDPYEYHEYHDEFEYQSTNADESLNYLLHLDCVNDMADQEAGTTLFCGSVMRTTTWLFAAEDSAGHTDCRVTGDDPGYYSELCTNVE